MLFGVLLNMTAEEGRSDEAVVREHIALGDLAEPLGFDSLFVLEHHFSGYVLSPAPFEILAFYAGRTKRIKLGTAVIVLPWHDPIRVAEQIATLDIISDGRCLFAFGRGRSEREFTGLRVPMNEARARFVEAAEILTGSLAKEVFEYAGEFYKIPALSIRPRAISKPQERFYGAAMGSASASMIARLGFGMLTCTQKPWKTLSSDVAHFDAEALSVGRRPPRPILLASISVANSRQQARERALEYFGREWALIDDHYRFSDGRLAGIRGYETYADTQRFFRQLSDQSFQDRATSEYADLQVVGTPDDCVQQIEKLGHLTGAEHLLLEFAYGGLPIKDAEDNMKMFATHVMPLLRSIKCEID